MSAGLDILATLHLKLINKKQIDYYLSDNESKFENISDRVYGIRVNNLEKLMLRKWKAIIGEATAKAGMYNIGVIETNAT